MILIFTNKEDITVDFVVERLSKLSIPFHRFNTEDYPTLYSIDVEIRNGRIEPSIRFGDFRILLSDVQSCWYRRPGAPLLNERVDEKGLRDLALFESMAMLDGVYRLLTGRWLNDPGAIRLAESKIHQLSLAASIGFSIPDTIVASDFDQIRKFIREHGQETIAKPLSTPTFWEGETEYVVFTSRLKLADLNDPLFTDCAPFIVQQQVHKTCDLRITVVGDTVFPAEIHSQAFTETSVDWRRGQRVDLNYAAHRLPTEIERNCVHLVERLGLRFGAIDMILDKAGAYWFLEINPNGQWAWIEQRLGFDITGAIVRELQAIGSQYVESD